MVEIETLIITSVVLTKLKVGTRLIAVVGTKLTAVVGTNDTTVTVQVVVVRSVMVLLTVVVGPGTVMFLPGSVIVSWTVVTGPVIVMFSPGLVIVSWTVVTGKVIVTFLPGSVIVTSLPGSVIVTFLPGAVIVKMLDCRGQLEDQNIASFLSRNLMRLSSMVLMCYIKAMNKLKSVYSLINLRKDAVGLVLPEMPHNLPVISKSKKTYVCNCDCTCRSLCLCSFRD